MLAWGEAGCNGQAARDENVGGGGGEIYRWSARDAGEVGLGPVLR